MTLCGAGEGMERGRATKQAGSGSLWSVDGPGSNPISESSGSAAAGASYTRGQFPVTDPVATVDTLAVVTYGCGMLM
jgi:hypothetical protein